MVLFITTINFVTAAIVTVHNHDIGPCNLFKKYNLFHDNATMTLKTMLCRHIYIYDQII